MRYVVFALWNTCRHPSRSSGRAVQREDAAGISLEQLRQVWSSVEQQAGTFGKAIDERVDIAPDSKDFKAVTLDCQFEKAVADFQIVFRRREEDRRPVDHAAPAVTVRATTSPLETEPLSSEIRCVSGRL